MNRHNHPNPHQWAQSFWNAGITAAQPQIVKNEIRCALYWGPRDRSRTRYMQKEVLFLLSKMGSN